jgi:dipeptidyl aminopeptidase/acylaminoacyl peptidase
VERRSPVRWIDRTDTPLLILQGGADSRVPPALTLALAGKLEAAHLLYELHIYAGDDHVVSRNRDDRIARTIAWFKARPRPTIADAMRRSLSLDPNNRNAAEKLDALTR